MFYVSELVLSRP